MRFGLHLYHEADMKSLFDSFACVHVSTIVPMLLLICVTSDLFGQRRADLCETDSLIFSTGWDRVDDTLEVFDDRDSYWRITRVVANPLPPRIPPWDAAIVQHARMSDGLCMWIAAYDRVDKPDTVNGTYTFETEFCVTEIVSEARLVCRYLVGSTSRVYLNGVPLGETPPNGVGVYDPAYIEEDVTPFLKPGINTMQVELDVPLRGTPALALTGYITAKSEETATPFSCDDCGQVVPKGRN